VARAVVTGGPTEACGAGPWRGCLGPAPL